MSMGVVRSGAKWLCGGGGANEGAKEYSFSVCSSIISAGHGLSFRDSQAPTSPSELITRVQLQQKENGQSIQQKKHR